MTNGKGMGETAKGRLEDVSMIRKSSKGQLFIVVKVSGTRYYRFDDDERVLNALIDSLAPFGGTVELTGVLGGQYPTFTDAKIVAGESRQAQSIQAAQEKTPDGKDWVRVKYENDIGVALGNALTRAVEIAVHDPGSVSIEKILENAGKMADWHLTRLRKELGIKE